MRKLYCAGIAALVLLLSGASAWIVISRDREGPEIVIEEREDLSWNPDMEKSDLLQGVTAADNRDGDVTESLMVESVRQEGDKAIVTYVAKDSNQNVTKKSKAVRFKDLEKETDNIEENQDGKSEEPAEEKTEPESTEEPEDLEAKAVEAREADIAALPEAAPRLYLKQHYVSINAGDSFDKLSWVEEITDVQDPRYYLFQYIIVEGEVNTWQPGTYELAYYAVDSDRNYSNRDILTVTVN